MRSDEEMSSQMRSYREPLGDGKRQKNASFEDGLGAV